jgi:hypothetical protein
LFAIAGGDGDAIGIAPPAAQNCGRLAAVALARIGADGYPIRVEAGSPVQPADRAAAPNFSLEI